MNALKKLSAIIFVLLPLLSLADFGLSSSPQFFRVDTGAGLTFKIRRTDNGSSVQSAGDIASIQFNGIEYQNPTRGSQINSGFDWLYKGVSSVSVEAQLIDNQYIVVTVNAGELTHYYIARDGFPHIYMATYFTSEPSIHGHVRYILRLNSSLLPLGPEPSNISRTVSTVEASDIFALPSGETRSKHYSNMRLKDWQFIGATGSNVGMWIVRGNQEGGSGGPFYRSLLNQGGSDQEITYIVNYAQAQTEPYRTHILNDYTFVVTNGSDPEPIDTSWFSKLNLKGYMSLSERGRVAAVAIHGRDSSFEYTVGFSNETAQYWVTPDSVTGFFKSPHMRPGEYTMTIYKNELSVYERSVQVVAGQTTLLNSQTIDNDPGVDASVWRIGKWDGSPVEMLNGDKLTTMHPSDTRIESWDPSNFIVGVHDDSDMPAYFWKDVNNNHIVYFKLNEAERKQNLVLRVGMTCAFSGGRARIHVNGWSSEIKGASAQPKTRSLTTGTYRCNNDTYRYEIPASAWQADSNEWNLLKLEVISGSGGQGFLSPAFSLDAIDLLMSEEEAPEEPVTPEEPVSPVEPNIELPETEDNLTPDDTSYIEGNATVPIGALPSTLLLWLLLLRMLRRGNGL